MKKVYVKLLTVLLMLPVGLASAEDCSAAKIRAFSDVFKERTKKTIGEALYSKTCSTRSSSTGLSVTLPFDGIPFTGNASSKAVRNACATKDKNFFEQYEADVLMLHTSESVKLALAQSCFGGVSMLAKEDSGSITVEIYARSIMDNKGATVESFTVSPSTAAKAVSKLPSPGDALPPKGMSLVFNRISGEDITFVINAADGNGHAIVTVPGTQEFKVKWFDTPVPIKRERGFTHLMFRCRGSIEGGEPEIVGGTIDGRPIGVTGPTNGSLRESYCRMKYGNSIAVVPGSNQLVSVAANWVGEPSSSENFSKWVCKRDGLDVGTLQCPWDPKKAALCMSDIGRAVACVDRYQNYDIAPAKSRVGT